jgi:hypothetical protein
LKINLYTNKLIKKEIKMLFGSCENSVKQGYEVRKDGFKHCGYCGSMDPVELAELIEKGEATLHGSDWKYGYPHKFYVDIPNPNAGQIVQIGSKCYYQGDKYIDEPIMGPDSEYLHLKFYTEHLRLIDDASFEKVAPIISKACGITFIRDDIGLLKYSAPYAGYQK